MKKAILVIIILLLLGVGGYFYMKSKGVTPNLPKTLVENKAAGSVFTSIQDALSKSLSLKCVYKNEKGVETTTYIKGGAVKVMMTGQEKPDEPNNILMKDKKMYMWSDTTKAGFVLAFQEPKNVSPAPTLEKQKGVEPEADQQKSVLAEIEKYKNACKPEVVSDTVFAIPTDVKFQDMESLKQQMMKGLPQGLPQITIPQQ